MRTDIMVLKRQWVLEKKLTTFIHFDKSSSESARYEMHYTRKIVWDSEGYIRHLWHLGLTGNWHKTCFKYDLKATLFLSEDIITCLVLSIIVIIGFFMAYKQSFSWMGFVLAIAP